MTIEVDRVDVGYSVYRNDGTDNLVSIMVVVVTMDTIILMKEESVVAYENSSYQ